MNSDTILPVLVAFLVGGLVADVVESYFTIAAAITTVSAVIGRSTAILLDRPKKQASRLTAYAAYFGLALSVLVILADIAFGS